MLSLPALNLMSKVKFVTFGTKYLRMDKVKFVANNLLNWCGLFNPLSANATKWSNILRQLVGKLPRNCLSVFCHFVGFLFKGLNRPYNFNFSKGCLPSFFWSIHHKHVFYGKTKVRLCYWHLSQTVSISC